MEVPGIAFPRRDPTNVWPEVALVAFVVVNLAAMAFVPGWETLPLHFVFVSVTIVYGLRAWGKQGTWLAIAGVGLGTGVMTMLAIGRGSEATAELAEVPLMTLCFAVMVLHVESRRRAGAAVAELAQERADALDHERRFFANASHELLTPLTVARGNLELLGRRTPPTPDEIRRTRDIVLDELDRTEQLISDLLTIGRLTAGVRLHLEPVDVEDFFANVASRWTTLARRAWTVDIRARGDVSIDQSALGRALDNVLENAFTHTQRGDAIGLEVAADGDRLRVTVSDSGTGIPAGAEARVFDRFYRPDESRSRATGGTGLGLSIVRDVLAAHGGEVHAESGAGRGTRIVMSLPGFVPAAARAWPSPERHQPAALRPAVDPVPL